MTGQYGTHSNGTGQHGTNSTGTGQHGSTGTGQHGSDGTGTRTNGSGNNGSGSNGFGTNGSGTDGHPGHHTGPHHAGSSRVGSLAGEAAQLLDVIAARLAAAQASRPDDATSVHSEPADRCPECGHLLGDEAAVMCTSCPVCRLLAVLRGQRPEVTATLVDAAAMAVSALRTLFADPPSAGPTGAPPHPPRASESTGVQRIHIQ